MKTSQVRQKNVKKRFIYFHSTKQLLNYIVFYNVNREKKMFVQKKINKSNIIYNSMQEVDIQLCLLLRFKKMLIIDVACCYSRLLPVTYI